MAALVGPTRLRACSNVSFAFETSSVGRAPRVTERDVRLSASMRTEEPSPSTNSTTSAISRTSGDSLLHFVWLPYRPQRTTHVMLEDVLDPPGGRMLELIRAHAFEQPGQPLAE